MDKKLKEPLNKDGFEIFVSENHKFGTDAILLADFAKARKGDRAVDLGTGCGIIPLLFLRDKKTEYSYGVDISEEAILLCEKTKEELSLSNFFPVLSSVTDLKGKIPSGINTLVTCNPPYKAKKAGLVSKGEKQRQARHETDATLEDFIKAAAKLLQTSGRLSMCIRPERTAELITLMSKNKIEPKRMRFVAKNKNSPPWLVLIEGRKCGNKNTVIEPTLFVLDENCDLSEEMRRIYGDYKTY